MSEEAVPRRKRLYEHLYFQILVAIAIAVPLGHFWPAVAVQLKPLGDAFIRLIKMVIPLVIFFTVVSGIAGMANMRQLGRIGGKSLLYFEIVSTAALAIGLLVGNLLTPGEGMNATINVGDREAVTAYAGTAREQGVVEFLLNIIPTTVVSAFADGYILPVVFVALLFGFAIAMTGERGRPAREVIESAGHITMTVVNLLMRLAPIGAFGAMAFTIGRYGVESLGPLVRLILLFYLTSALFVGVVLGLIARAAGFSIFRLLVFLREELLIVLGTSSSDAALPALMRKLEEAGCPRPIVGLVVPTGYVFNTDGTSIYMTLAALFVAQATNTDLTFTQQAALFGVAMLTSKGASGITGASFVALVGTLSVVPTIPLAGMALILGIDRFMSEARALVNVIGNAVATIVIARWEGVLDREQLRTALSGAPLPAAGNTQD